MQRSSQFPARRVRQGQAPRSGRAAFSLFELSVAVIILGVVFAGLGPLLTLIRLQRTMAAERQTASIELANIAERLAIRPFDELTPESLAAIELSSRASAMLQGAALSIDAADESEPAAKRITLELTWMEDGSRRSAPLRLVVWRRPPREGAP